METRLLREYFKKFLSKAVERENLLKIMLLMIIVGFSWSLFTQLNRSQTYIVDEVHYVCAAKNLLTSVFGYNITWNIKIPESHVNYINLEHPPLGKWLIAVCLMLLGDYPYSWRIPSAVSGVLTVLLAYFIGKKLGGEVAGILSSLLVACDPMIYSMSSVAMLDMVQTVMIVIAIASLLYWDNVVVFSIFAGLSISVKLSSAFILYGIILYLIVTAETRIRALIRILTVILVVSVVYLIVNVPLIIHFGPEEWFDLQMWMIKVHSSFKESHPSLAVPFNFYNPLENWLLNFKPFPLTGNLYAQVNPAITIPGALALAYLLYDYLKNRRYNLLILPAWFFSGYILYILLYIAGRTMQFIFYMTPLTPALDIGLPVALSLIERTFLTRSN